MVLVTIQLEGGDKSQLFTHIEIDSKIHSEGLKEKIKYLTAIPPDFQQINIGRDNLPDPLHPLASIDEFTKIIVKHASLPLWLDYKEYVLKVLKEKDALNKVEIAKKVVQHHDLLTNSGFFTVYPKFSHFHGEHHYKVAYWADDNIDLILNATKDFFLKLHNQRRGNEDSEFICDFYKRDEELGGESTSIFAFVRIHGEDAVKKYYVKCHHYGPKGTSSGKMPDITELYTYKLLELIGVGPKVYIIPPRKSTGAKTSTYIASQWDDRLQLLETFVDKDLSVDLCIQLITLKVLLFIADLHEENCGRWNDENDVAIVDFAPTEDFIPYSYGSIESTMVDMIPHKCWRKEFNEVRNQYDKKSWLKLAKKYLDKWDLSKNIDLARVQFDPDESILKSLENDFKMGQLRESPTDMLEEYISTLNENLKNLQSLLNSIV